MDNEHLFRLPPLSGSHKLTREDAPVAVPKRIGRPPKVVEPLTMTSLEIAEYAGKEHRNVMRDIRDMLLKLDYRLLSFEQTRERPNPSGGNPIKSDIYVLPKDLTLTLVSGYDVITRHRIITRWLELEGGGVPAPKTYAKTSVSVQIKVERAGTALEFDVANTSMKELAVLANALLKG